MVFHIWPRATVIHNGWMWSSQLKPRLSSTSGILRRERKSFDKRRCRVEYQPTVKRQHKPQRAIRKLQTDLFIFKHLAIFLKNVKTERHSASTPTFIVGCITGANRAEWFPGISSPELCALSQSSGSMHPVSPEHAWNVSTGSQRGEILADIRPGRVSIKAFKMTFE